MSEADATLANRIIAAVRDLRSAPDEHALQATIAERLAGADIGFEREVRLSTHDRIDFLCDAVGVEVKVDGSLAAVTRQLHRYAQSPRVRHLVLITTKLQHARAGGTMNGKTVAVAHLIGCSL